MAKKSVLPKDTNKRAKSVVGMATAEPETLEVKVHGKNPNAVALGRKGGLKGGKARAAKLTPARRKAIAKKAAAARWKDKEDND